MADLDRLATLGFDLAEASDDQLAVLTGLSDEEIDLLARIKSRLDDASDDVEGHLEGGGFCW
jgi:hypothetical protein